MIECKQVLVLTLDYCVSSKALIILIQMIQNDWMTFHWNSNNNVNNGIGSSIDDDHDDDDDDGGGEFIIT